MEPEDADIRAALVREVFEEAGGTLEQASQVLVLAEPGNGGISVHHFFLAVLTGIDLEARTGTEFGKPERGSYDLDRVPFTAEGTRSVRLAPPELAAYLAANCEGLLSLLEPDSGT